MIEANIKADAQPAAMAMRTIAIISCPAPFERLEVLRTPTIGNRTTREPYENARPAARTPRADITELTDHVRQQPEETRALDGAREFALLLGGGGGGEAPHHPSRLRGTKP